MILHPKSRQEYCKVKPTGTLGLRTEAARAAPAEKMLTNQKQCSARKLRSHLALLQAYTFEVEFKI